MVGVLDNLSTTVALLPDGLVKNIGSFILVLKAVGIAFIIYVVYLIVKAFFNLRRYKMLKRVDERIELIEQKVDLILAEQVNKKKRVKDTLKRKSSRKSKKK